jgi:hypothetical protein
VFRDKCLRIDEVPFCSYGSTCTVKVVKLLGCAKFAGFETEIDVIWFASRGVNVASTRSVPPMIVTGDWIVPTPGGLGGIVRLTARVDPPASS